MFAGTIARVVEHRPRRFWSAERLIVADIDPDPAGAGLALGQTGTVVSSPCSRSALSTWASRRWNNGVSATVQPPTWSAS